MKENTQLALRAALNMNKTALVQRHGKGYTGLAIRIAERIGAEMDASLALLE